MNISTSLWPRRISTKRTQRRVRNKDVFSSLSQCTQEAHWDNRQEKFINTISKAILPSLQRTFKNDLKHAASVAAAKAGAITLLSVSDRMLWQY